MTLMERQERLLDEEARKRREIRERKIGKKDLAILSDALYNGVSDKVAKSAKRIAKGRSLRIELEMLYPNDVISRVIGRLKSNGFRVKHDYRDDFGFFDDLIVKL